MNSIPTETCKHCGAPTHQEAFCPSCGRPLRELFADANLLEYCTNTLLALEETLKEIPPFYGWSILIMWFGFPIFSLLVAGLWMGGVVGWLVGIGVAVFLFFIQVPGVALLRKKVFYRQYDRKVRPQIDRLLKNTNVQTSDLLLLARQVEKLQKSALLGYLEEDETIRKTITPPVPKGNR